MSEPGSSRRFQAFAAFVAGAFFMGWVMGLAVVFKLWRLSHAPRWMMSSGMGTVSIMMAPVLTGALFSLCIGRLAARGWRGAPLGLVGLGACGLVAGLLAL